jgi:MFS family permease
MVSLQQWAITWGILIQYFIQYGASFYDGGVHNPTQGPGAFRIPWAIQIIPAIILFIGLFWFPYSPRWLASKDRWEETLEVLSLPFPSPKYPQTHSVQVLADVHGNGNKSDPKVLAEFKEIEDAIRFEHEEAISSFAELTKPRTVKRVVLGVSLQMWSQLCGMNVRSPSPLPSLPLTKQVMMYYIVYVMQGAGINDPLLTASIQYIINVAMTIPAIIYIDKLGRRPALLVGSFLMMTWLFISGAIQGAYGEPETDPTQPITWKLVNKPAQAKAVIACSYLCKHPAAVDGV